MFLLISKSVKGGHFLFHAVVAFWYQKRTDFKVIYSTQFKRYGYIEGIWVVQNFMENRLVKKFLARAHFHARAGRIFYHLGEKWVILKCLPETWDLARAPNFFSEMNSLSRNLFATFLFDHSSKTHYFRAIWSLVKFLKFRFFFENCACFFIAVLRTYGDSSFFRVLPIVETLKVLLPFSKYFLKDFGKDITFLRDFGRKKITKKNQLFRFLYYW